MSGSRLSEALRRIGAAVGARLVRTDDAARTTRNDGPVGELHSRMDKFATEVEAKSLDLQRSLSVD